MIPIRDLNHTRRTPVVTWSLIAANVLLFIGTLSLGSKGAEDVVLRFGVIPDVLVHGNWGATRSAGGSLGSWVTRGSLDSVPTTTATLDGVMEVDMGLPLPQGGDGRGAPWIDGEVVSGVSRTLRAGCDAHGSMTSLPAALRSIIARIATPASSRE